MVKHTFSVKGNQRENNPVDEEGEFELDVDKTNEWDEMFIETEASKYMQHGDVAAIKTGDDHHYYQLQVTYSLFKTESKVTNDYQHSFPPALRIAEGHYVEVYKETNNDSLDYINNARKALISAFSIDGSCPELPETLQKKRGKVVEMFIIDHDMHQALFDLVKSNFILLVFNIMPKKS